MPGFAPRRRRRRLVCHRVRVGRCDRVVRREPAARVWSRGRGRGRSRQRRHAGRCRHHAHLHGRRGRLNRLRELALLAIEPSRTREQLAGASSARRSSTARTSGPSTWPDGFSTLGPTGSTQLFLSVTKFQDLYYLGSNVGLFQVNSNAPSPVFQKVRTRLQPELLDANIAQSVDDVLWSLGTKHLARFDGATWERFHHPDNAPIGGAAPG